MNTVWSLPTGGLTACSYPLNPGKEHSLLRTVQGVRRQNGHASAGRFVVIYIRAGIKVATFEGSP